MRWGLIASCVFIFVAFAARADSYTTLATVCSLDADSVVFEVIFDNELNREKLGAAVGSAFERAGFRLDDCAQKPPLEKTKEPRLIKPGADESTAILVVYSGWLPAMQPAGDDWFVSEFAEWPPSVFIAESGEWMLGPHTAGEGRRLYHGPPSNGYTHPRTLLRCPDPSAIAERDIASDHLMQIVEISCADGTDRLMFFGLGKFVQGVNEDAEFIVDGAAYLALEFDVHRVLAQVLR